MGGRIPVVEFETAKQLQREFSSTVKALKVKENEANWESRETALLRIRGILRSEYATIWKELVVQGIRDLANGIVGVLQSLRTTLALEALDLIGDIGTYIGTQLDAYTFETFFTSLLRCASLTKKIIATHSMQVMVTFISMTTYYLKMLHHLSAALDEKNNQVRHFATLYLRTIIQTHGPKDGTRAMIERNGSIEHIERFLRKGFFDAAPVVRESCRQTFWLFRKYWPSQAERFSANLDAITQRQLEKSMPSKEEIDNFTINAISDSRLSLARSSRQSLRSSDRTTLSRPSLTPSISTSSSRTTSRIMPSRTFSTTSSIPSELKRTLSFNRSTSKPLTKIRSNIPSPSTSRQKATDTARSMAYRAILRKLQADDVTANCEAIQQLISQLKHSADSILESSTLSSDTLSKVDLLPILVGYLSRTDKDVCLYETLMSWDSLANVFVRLLCFNHYAPTLIINSQRCMEREKNMSAAENHIMHVYATGLKRLKIYLKKSDPLLVKKLLDVMSASNGEESSSSTAITRSILAVEGNRDRLIRGLLEWIDEITCEYVGLANDEEDASLLSEGAEWLKVLDDTEPAFQWFDDNQNLGYCLDTVLSLHHMVDEDSATHEAYNCLIGRLRLVNERVFDTVSGKHGLVIEDLLNSQRTRTSIATSCSSVEKDSQPDELDLADELSKFDNSLGSIRLCDGSPEPVPYEVDMLMITNNEEESTGVTADISKILLGAPQVTTKENDAIFRPQTVNDSSEFQDTCDLYERAQSSSETIIPRTIPGKHKRTTSSVDSGFERSGVHNHSDVEEHMKKRRRITMFHDISIPKSIPDRADLLYNLTLRIKERNDVDDILFRQLQKLSKETRVSEGCNEENQPANLAVWSRSCEDGNSFILLLETLVVFLASLDDDKTGINEQTRVDAIVLIKQLITNQTKLFKQYEPRDKQKAASSSLTYRIVNVLLDNQVDMSNDILAASKDALQAVLSAVSLDFGISIIWSTLDRFMHTEGTSLMPSLPKTRDSSLAFLFSYLGKLAPNTPAETMEEHFRNGTAEILLKGYNHENVSVRTSCVQALVGIHRSLGDDYLKTYLSSLRNDQMSLLQHFIAQTANST
ncbi:suppressor of tub2 mutation [Apophysomyces ossiformis]|uniref:Suppressor of tub2 mutation n=1 Tax=Apophysomyces ossiformis TaxID=679940 RepID=A0A8H7BZM4_9FUNG|nr:suppressor of tub2 mutation [Apophysomyces ossiformis]